MSNKAITAKMVEYKRENENLRDVVYTVSRLYAQYRERCAELEIQLEWIPYPANKPEVEGKIYEVKYIRNGSNEISYTVHEWSEKFTKLLCEFLEAETHSIYIRPMPEAYKPEEER